MSTIEKIIGFIGLGVMGKPMASNLLRAGYSVMVLDVLTGPVEELVSEGAIRGESPENIGEKCSVIITMLPNSPQVREVITGVKIDADGSAGETRSSPGKTMENSVLAKIKPGTILIDMSSITPQTAIEMAEAAAGKECEMLDAPVSGGEPKAIDGTLSIMAGGKQEVFEKVEKILLSMGNSAVLIGEVGSGNTAKLANQIMVALHLASVSEAMVFAEKAGVDPGKVYQAIRGGLAGSTVLDAKAPLILERNFKPGGPIRMHTKDLLNVSDTASEIGAPIPLTGKVLEYMQSLIEDGRGMDDHCGIIQYWEKLAGVTVGKK